MEVARQAPSVGGLGVSEHRAPDGRYWIQYCEPRRGWGRQSYFAMARVHQVIQDPEIPVRHYALMSGYLELVVPVPLREPTGRYYESILRKPDGSTSKGAFRRLVRLVPDREC